MIPVRASLLSWMGRSAGTTASKLDIYCGILCRMVYKVGRAHQYNVSVLCTTVKYAENRFRCFAGWITPGEP